MFFQTCIVEFSTATGIIGLRVGASSLFCIPESERRMLVDVCRSVGCRELQDALLAETIASAVYERFTV